MDNKTNKMLIDATHPEETRVVVLRNGRVEEFDFESASRVPLRGNIYLAKVTRVEPSLQAAFVEYGGNRHGFLAFNEIHPDYYQIPVSDRQALLDEEAAAEAEEDARADARAEARERRQAQRDRPSSGGSDTNDNRTGDDAQGQDPAHYADMHPTAEGYPAEPLADGQRAVAETSGHVVPVVSEDHQHDHHDHAGETVRADHIEEVPVVSDAPEVLTPGAADDIGGDDDFEEQQDRPRRRPRSYKIQEVIKRRQIILVQVVKEERGNKGAALTTYLSLAGRFTVLMPNTGRGGGISRKITQPQDRKRLKAIASELAVPEGMGLIIRTAGAARTKQEINRDFEYLLRLWESVRELTLESTAPSLVYEEGDLIKRSIRDLYGKDVDQVIVSGAHAYREASDFMRMLMPSHAKNVINYQAPEPLFARYRIEPQLNAMFSPYVTLKSGGYLVINQTEALVSVDVNSGKSTREFSIEETALNTNLEASDEVARQLKLRDLAGLIVIDFIDMEERRNNRKVENRLKDALRHDRARIQVGRISHFGLMEMSRQRLRTGVLEGSTTQCPHCQGTGTIRSTESVALGVIRGLEDYLMRDARSSVTALTTAHVALYILNHKRSFIIEMENRFGVSVAVIGSDKMHGANFGIEKSAEPLKPKRAPDRAAVNMESGFDGEEPHVDTEDDLHDVARLDSNVEDVDQDDDEFERDTAQGGQREAGAGNGRSDADGARDGNAENSDGGRRRRRRRRGRGRDGRVAGDQSGAAQGQNGQNQNGYSAREFVDDAGDRDQNGAAALAPPSAGGSDTGFVDADETGDGEPRQDEGSNAQQDGDRTGRRRRRGRRGGRGRDREGGQGTQGDRTTTAGGAEQQPGQDHVAVARDDDHAGHDHSGHAHHGQSADHGDTRSPPMRPERQERQPRISDTPVMAPPVVVSVISAAVPVQALVQTPVDTPSASVDEPTADDASRPVRKGWWQRKFGA